MAVTGSGSTGNSDEDRGTRILIVEDDSQVRRLLTLILESAGYAPTAVATMTQARAVDVGSIDLIVCDLHLNDGNGLELMAKLLAEAGPDRLNRFVMVSGDLDPAVIRDVEAVGGTFLAKPFTNEEVVETVGRALAAG